MAPQTLADHPTQAAESHGITSPQPDPNPTGGAEGGVRGGHTPADPCIKPVDLTGVWNYITTGEPI
jgi:hypothetical protein